MARWETGSFRYCGKEIVQDEDFNIHVTCSETTRNVSKIHLDKTRHPGDPLTAWVCRQCRPNLSYRVSKIQSASSNGTVADIKDANKAVEYAYSHLRQRTCFQVWSVGLEDTRSSNDSNEPGDHARFARE